MKGLMMAAAAAALLMVSVPASAQVTGPKVLTMVQAHLANNHQYATELKDNCMLVRDAASGNEVVRIDEVNPQTLTLSGRVGTLESLSDDKRAEVLARIAILNFSMPVGTLAVDPDGEVTMIHHLNQSMLTVPTLARTTELFGEVVSERSKTLIQ